jgi:hypothetical protein
MREAIFQVEVRGGLIFVSQPDTMFYVIYKWSSGARRFRPRLATVGGVPDDIGSRLKDESESGR